MNLEELVADPTPERFSVYADHLQTLGDPRGELIALAGHPRAAELEQQFTTQLLAKLDGGGGVTLTWERGFVREMIVPSTLMPALVATHWLDEADFAMVRSFRIHDDGGELDSWFPIEELVDAPLARTLQRLAAGSSRRGIAAERLVPLITGLPALNALEWCSNQPFTEEHLRVLGQLGLEAVTLWMPARHEDLGRIVATPWPNLRALTLGSPPHRSIPSMLPPILPTALEPILDGTAHPHLVELGWMNAEGNGLLAGLADRPLGKRLRRLGLHWADIETTTLEQAKAALEHVELFWPTPAGITLTADEEYNLARRLRVGLGRKREARIHALRSCELDASDYFHWTEAGYVHEGLDELPEMLAAMDKAIEVEPERWGGWAGRGTALRGLGRFPEARAAYLAGIEASDSVATLHNGLAQVYECEGNADDAIKSLEHAYGLCTTDTNRAWYRARIAHALLEFDRPVEAHDQLAQSRALDGENLRAARYTGYQRLLVGTPEEALAIANEIGGRASGEAEFSTHTLRASALRELGGTDEAKALYRRIFDETDCPSWIGLAWLGTAACGEDHAAPFSAIVDPRLLGDAVAAHVNATRTAPIVHDTVDRCNDQIMCAVALIGCAAAAGRLDEVDARKAALIAYLRGPAPVKYVAWWLELGELMRVVARQTGVDLDAAYRLSTGDAMR